jgi:creatinine amidohydrolase
VGGYSIFEGTVADMTWPEVEQAALKNAVMLVPVAVIEQHGPHLPLATDTYGACLLCSLAKVELARRGTQAVVAPPYYLGMNPTTGMFPGSLSISHETMVRALTETLSAYAKWGFSQQFVINHHGDPDHNDAIAVAIAAVRAEGVNAVLTLGGFVGRVVEEVYASAFGKPLPLPENAILRAEESMEAKEARERLTRSSLSIHAEERETSLIMKWFPDLLNKEVHIAELEPVLPSAAQLAAALQEGKWREVSPLGYIGDPSVATSENGELYAYEATDIAHAILRFLGRSPDIPQSRG